MFVSFLKKRIQVLETTSIVTNQKNFVVLQYDYLNLRDLTKVKELFSSFSFRFIKKKAFSKFFSHIVFDFFFQSRFIFCFSSVFNPDLSIELFKTLKGQDLSFRFVCIFWSGFFFNRNLLDFCLSRGFFFFLFFTQFIFLFFMSSLMFRIFSFFNLGSFISSR